MTPRLRVIKSPKSRLTNRKHWIRMRMPAGQMYGIEQDGHGFSHVRLLHPTARAAANTPAVVVLIDMAMLFSLFTFVVYLLRGGLGEIQGWFFLQVRR